MVLIKNQGNVLPFKKNPQSAGVGQIGRPRKHRRPRLQPVYAPYVVTPLEGLKKYFGEGVEVLHRDETQIAAAKQLAGEVDCVVIVAGNDFNDEGEFITPSGGDFMAPVIAVIRTWGNRFMPPCSNLCKNRWATKWSAAMAHRGRRPQESVAQTRTGPTDPGSGRVNPNTVVCLVCGSMIMTTPGPSKYDDPLLLVRRDGRRQRPAPDFVRRRQPQRAAALQHSGRREPFTLFQQHRPGDHLRSLSRLYAMDKNGLTPAYPFRLWAELIPASSTTTPTSTRTGQTLEVSVKSDNSGSRDGEEVVQVYVGMDTHGSSARKSCSKALKKWPSAPERPLPSRLCSRSRTCVITIWPRNSGLWNPGCIRSWSGQFEQFVAVQTWLYLS